MAVSENLEASIALAQAALAGGDAAVIEDAVERFRRAYYEKAAAAGGGPEGKGET